MADVTTTFAAKDESFAKTVDKLQGRLTGFSGSVEGFNTKVASMASSFAKLAGPIAGIATAFFGVKTAAQAFSNALELGGRLDDLSTRAGTSAGEMLVLGKAFELAGSSADNVGPTITRLQRFLAEASESGSQQSATLTRLGLTYQQLAALTPTEQMRLLADRISAIEEPAFKAQAAVTIFGKSGGDLIPLLAKFSGELAKAQGYLGSLPRIMDENAAAFADLDDNIREISNKFDQFVAGLITNMVPALNAVAEKLANLDAAGLGEAFSNYITSALKAMANTYLLGAAIDSVKLAIEAIVSGNYSDGLSLMWVTMKVTALNAVNEIVSNFVAGVKSIADFAVTTMGPGSALFRLVGNAFTLMALNFESSMSAAVANVIQHIPGFGAAAAESLRAAADQARASAGLLQQEILAGAKVVGDEFAKAGSALPENFAKNKDALDPLFDLTDEFAEQKTLQESITASIVAAQPPAEKIAAAAKDFRDALFDVPTTLKSVVDLSGELFTNLNNAAIGAQNVGRAFELNAQAASQMSEHINNTSASANQASNFLGEGAAATNALDINGRSYADSTAAAAANIKGAKGDAQITADIFTGMSDRMAKGATAVDQSIEKMREAHHFGQQTYEEMYDRLEAGGQSIFDATKNAGRDFAAQSQLSTDMRKLENRASEIHGTKQRALDRAARYEERGHDTSANNIRRRAEERFTKEMEKLAPEAEKGATNARKQLEAAGSTSGGSVLNGGNSAGSALQEGANAIKEATSGGGGGGGGGGDPIQTVLDGIKTFLDKTFDDFKKRVPQNVLG
jgi:hypothetical protein